LVKPRHFVGLTTKEAAKLLEISPRTARNLLGARSHLALSRNYGRQRLILVFAGINRRWALRWRAWL